LPDKTAPAVSAEGASQLFGSLLVTVAASFYGVGTTFSRLAYDGGSNPLTIVFLRSTAFVILVVLLLAMLGRPMRVPAGGLFATLWMAFTLSMVSAGYQSSVAFIPVSLAALLFYTYPLLVGIFATAMGRDRLTLVKALALAAAFIGLALALGPGFEQLDWRGVAGALVAAIGMMLTITFSGEAMRGRDTLAMNFYTNLWMVLGFGLSLAVAGAFSLPTTESGMFGAAGVSISYCVAFTTWFIASRRVTPVRLATHFNVEPLVSIFMAWVVLGERLGTVQLTGVALVIGAVLVTTISGSRARQAA
jgi:drug/metabolite transporter (DMT)-like permease